MWLHSHIWTHIPFRNFWFYLESELKKHVNSFVAYCKSPSPPPYPFLPQSQCEWWQTMTHDNNDPIAHKDPSIGKPIHHSAQPAPLTPLNSQHTFLFSPSIYFISEMGLPFCCQIRHLTLECVPIKHCHWIQHLICIREVQSWCVHQLKIHCHTSDRSDNTNGLNYPTFSNFSTIPL